MVALIAATHAAIRETKEALRLAEDAASRATETAAKFDETPHTTEATAHRATAQCTGSLTGTSFTDLFVRNFGNNCRNRKGCPPYCDL